MRLANEIAAGAMEHVQSLLRPGMPRARSARCGTAGCTSTGQGSTGRSSSPTGSRSLRSRPGIRTFTATAAARSRSASRRSSRSGCADGYWCDHTKNLVPGELDARYAELEQQPLRCTPPAARRFGPVTAWPSGCRSIRAGLAEGYPGQPSHPVCHGVGARAHEPPYAHQAGGGTIETGMVLAIEPGVYWPEGGGLRVEDNFLITGDGPSGSAASPTGS